jgi:hypothetical protein
VVSARVLIRCPRTERPVYTGLNLDWSALEACDLPEQKVVCPECGEEHVWSKPDAVPVADGGEG